MVFFPIPSPFPCASVHVSAQRKSGALAPTQRGDGNNKSDVIYRHPPHSCVLFASPLPFPLFALRRGDGGGGDGGGKDTGNIATLAVVVTGDNVFA